jgi:hypothetical protein
MTEHNPNLVPWLRAAQERGGKGTVELDARSIGRVADWTEALESELNRVTDRLLERDRMVAELEGALNRIATGNGTQRDIGIAVNALAGERDGN